MPPDTSFQHITPDEDDGVVSALTGNGTLCTTLAPHGYHIAPEEATTAAHRTQYFVMAGRRQRGARHLLTHFGTLTRQVWVDGDLSEPQSGEQYLQPPLFRVLSYSFHPFLREEVLSHVLLTANAFRATGTYRNTDSTAHTVRVRIAYRYGDPAARRTVNMVPDGVHLAYELEEQTGDIHFGFHRSAGETVEFQAAEDRTVLEVSALLEPEQTLTTNVWLHFSDRLHYEFPLNTREKKDFAVQSHAVEAQRWMQASAVVTGNKSVDGFRDSACYTLRCQATPWSIPPTVSEPYWGAGTFHDEMYPFFGLLSGNHADLAKRIPYFRLATLPQAQQRARGRGALYPWSSTEDGQERDPNGLWLTERFHLGQFAVCIWHLWLYERDVSLLDDLYPVLRDIARYYENEMIERDDNGRWRTRACVDFDESVGAVTNGPFTISAAIASLEYAANAAAMLMRDGERAERWRTLANGLRESLPQTEGDDGSTGIYTIPDDKPLHYSLLGHIFPFRTDVQSLRARRSAEHIHRVCRSTQGWKPGFSEVFTGSNWIWTAGHLGIVHAMQENAALAWEAVRDATLSAGAFLSPNEHRDRNDVVQVPWFTTGCGAWLYALHALFVQVDEAGTRLLPAVPTECPNAHFTDLRGDSGVLVSAAFSEGRLVSLTARRDPQSYCMGGWAYRLPARYVAAERLNGQVRPAEAGWLHVTLDALTPDSVSLLRP